MQRDKYQLKRTKREPPENHTRILKSTPYILVFQPSTLLYVTTILL